MNPKLVLALADVKYITDADFLLVCYATQCNLFHNRWFLPGFIIDPGQDLSALEEMNNHTVKFFDMDFHLKSWGLQEEVTLDGDKYDLVVMQGTLTNGRFSLNEQENYYLGAWMGNDPLYYIRHSEERELFEKILEFEASK